MRQAVIARLVSHAMMTAGAALALPTSLRAQTPAAIGMLAGRDASVEHPAAATVNNVTGTPVGNGSVIVVHSGKARVQLTGGDTISICGPAKFTVLQSGNALTLALEFGSLHVSLQNTTTPLEAYTPFFTALPVSTEGGHREFTIGLDANGTFCTRAIRGGVKLEQQLTGHSLIVPEPSETFLRGGDITPLRDPPGHCECAVTPADVAAVSAPPAETATAAPATKPGPIASANSAAPTGTAREAAPPATAGSPTPLATLSAPPAPSATASAGANVTMPTLAFDYSSRNTLANMNSDTAALLDDSRVTSGWIFHGQVGKGSTPVAASVSSAHAPAQTSAAQKHEGFWSKLKHFFGGRD